jgi:hypothetical protein
MGDLAVEKYAIGSLAIDIAWSGSDFVEDQGEGEDLSDVDE